MGQAEPVSIDQDRFSAGEPANQGPIPPGFRVIGMAPLDRRDRSAPNGSPISEPSECKRPASSLRIIARTVVGAALGARIRSKAI